MLLPAFTGLHQLDVRMVAHLEKPRHTGDEDELGIELDTSRGVQKVSGESALTGALKDGRLVKLELEDSIIADVARYL